jgi:hypothetical protein
VVAKTFGNECMPKSILSSAEMPDCHILSVRSAVAKLNKFNGQGYTPSGHETGCQLSTGLARYEMLVS